MSELTLIVDSQYASPYAMCAYVALKEKGLAVDVITLDLAELENHQTTYAQQSLTQRVPTLIHNGFSLSESSAICEYLEDTFPAKPLYPKSIEQRARARQLQAWLRSDLLPIREERSTEVLFYNPTTSPLSAEAETARDKLIFVAEQLLQDNRENLFGEWSIADLDLSIMLNRLVINGDPVPARLKTYATHQWQRDSVISWVSFPRPAL